MPLTAAPARPVTPSRHLPGFGRPPLGHRGDDGGATLELTVLFPVVLLILFGVIQGALYFHGRNVAMAAAEQGVRAARANGQTDRAGTATARARRFLADTGELDNLTALRITPDIAARTVRVTVTARTISLLPGVPGPRVSQTAAGVIERFTNNSNR